MTQKSIDLIEGIGNLIACDADRLREGEDSEDEILCDIQDQIDDLERILAGLFD